MSDTAAAAALTPPSQLALTAPEPVKPVEPAKAGGMVPIPPRPCPHWIRRLLLTSTRW